MGQSYARGGGAAGHAREPTASSPPQAGPGAASSLIGFSGAATTRLGTHSLGVHYRQRWGS